MQGQILSGPFRAAVLALLAALLLAGCLPGGCNEEVQQESPAAGKYIILFIGDGLQLEHERAASLYLHGADRQLSFHSFSAKGYAATWDVTTYDRYAGALGRTAYKATTFDPLVGYDPALGGPRPYPESLADHSTYFLTKLPKVDGSNPAYPATDSASAATAIATGVKTEDGNIAWLPGDPAGGALTTIMERARAQQGKAIGVVSTVPFSHATPAAFVSHNVSRSNYQAIASEIIHTIKPEVVIGAGHPGWNASPHQYLAPAEYDALKDGSSGYTLVERQGGVVGGSALLAAARDPAVTRLFGLFGGADGHFESPVPTTDGSRLIQAATTENPTLAEATEAALTVLARDRDGFLVLIEQGDIDWANHANDYARMVGTVYDLDRAVAAAVAFVDRPGDDLDWYNTLLIVTSDHGNGYLRIQHPAGLRNGRLPSQQVDAGVFIYPDGEVTYGSGSHTNELVTWYARGQGSKYLCQYEGRWYPGTRIIDNTDLFQAMLQAAQLAP